MTDAPPTSPAPALLEPHPEVRADIRRALFYALFFFVLFIVAAFGLIAEF